MQKFLGSRSAKAAILASGNFLSMCANILIAAVLTRLFLKAEYATYQQTFIAFNFVVPLLTLGIPMALYFYMPQRTGAARSVLLENLIILSIGAVGFAVFIFFGGNQLLAWQFKNPELAGTLLLLVPYGFFELYSRSVGPCLMANDKVPQVAIFNVITRLVLLVFSVTAALIFGTTRAVIIAAVLASGFRMGIGMFLMLAATRDTAWRPTQTGVMQQLKYGVPLGIAGVFGTLTLTLDKFIVASICDIEDFAVYTVGAFELPVIGIVTGSVTAVLLTDLSVLFAEQRLSEATQLWGRAALKCSLLLLPLMVGMFVIAPDVITLLFSEKYADSVLPFRMYLLLLPIRIANYGSMIMAAGQSRLILLRALIAFILNAGLSILLTYYLGYVGAISATVVVMYLWSVPFNLIAISRLWGTTTAELLPWKKLASVLLISIATTPVLLANDFLSISSKLLLFSILVPIYAILVSALFVYSGLITKEFPALVVANIKKYISPN